mmetsp:Transcript_14358/g.30840  ORF Transcript_14358/g.30840 Transcript_14358/m.30840 type:complete len:141 (-) Transcript_14358:467-889(-)
MKSKLSGTDGESDSSYELMKTRCEPDPTLPNDPIKASVEGTIDAKVKCTPPPLGVWALAVLVYVLRVGDVNLSSSFQHHTEYVPSYRSKHQLLQRVGRTIRNRANSSCWWQLLCYPWICSLSICMVTARSTHHGRVRSGV